MAFRTLRGVCAALGIAILTLFFAVGCRTIKPYEKEYLLHPTMDDARVDRLSAPYGKSIRPNERLAVAAGGGSSYACPTCGGK
jgi:hypothetical protein